MVLALVSTALVNTALVIIVGSCAGCAAVGARSQGPAGNSGPTTAISAIPRAVTWKKTVHKAVPVVRRTPSATTSPTRHQSVQQLFTADVAPLIAADGYRAAVSVDDLTTGQVADVDGGQEFITASIAKADILATLLYQLQRRGGQLSKSQAALAVRMIEESDNNAATAIYNEDGEADGIDAANQAFGLTRTTAGSGEYWGLTTTTTEDQVRLLRQIFTSSSVLDSASRAYIQSLMGAVEPAQQWGVPAAADSGTPFAVKNGWLPDPHTHLWEVNSIGEVTHGGQRMLVTVLSTGDTNFSDGIALVEGISVKAAGAMAGK
jgi:hypothetical protein